MMINISTSTHSRGEDMILWVTNLEDVFPPVRPARPRKATALSVMVKGLQLQHAARTVGQRGRLVVMSDINGKTLNLLLAGRCEMSSGASNPYSSSRFRFSFQALDLAPKGTKVVRGSNRKSPLPWTLRAR